MNGENRPKLKIEKNIEIPEYYKEALERSIEQMKKGKTIPNSEVENDIEEWLYK